VKSPLHQIAKIWLSRLVWLLVVIPLLVALLHLQTGIRHERMDPFTLADGRVITEAWRSVWDPTRALAQLKEFPGELIQGKVLYKSSPHDRGSSFLPMLKQGWFYSFELYAVSVGVGALLGVLIGVLVALRGRLLRGASITVSVLGLSMPDFFVVMSLQFLSSWFWRHYDLKPFLVLADPNILKGWVVPVIGMTLFPIGYMARLTASAMDDVMQEEYIRTARSKGLRESAVVLGHALRNAIPRMLAGLPTLLNVTLSSLVVVERFTVWPGISKWFVPMRPSPGFEDQLFGATPAVASVAVMLLILWFVLFDGLAHTIRIIYSPKQPEVVRA
jgi:ABC-type dipeptide/oligopeptide/nickel transport system permease component